MNTIDDSQNTAPGRLLGIIHHRLRERMRAELQELGLRRGSWRLLHTLADGPATADELSAALPGGRRHGEPRGEGHAHGSHHEHGHDHDHHEPHGRGRFGTPEEREAFFEKRHPEFAERFPTPEEREAFRAGMHVRLGFGPRGRGGWGGRGGWAARGERGADGEHGSERHEHGHRGSGGARVARTLRDFAERGWIREDVGVVTLTDAGREAHDRAFSRIEDLRGSVTAGVSDEDYATMIATLEAMARNLGWERPTAS